MFMSHHQNAEKIHVTPIAMGSFTNVADLKYSGMRV
jgi:hypothetical protein